MTVRRYCDVIAVSLAVGAMAVMVGTYAWFGRASPSLPWPVLSITGMACCVLVMRPRTPVQALTRLAAAALGFYGATLWAQAAYLVPKPITHSPHVGSSLNREHR